MNADTATPATKTTPDDAPRGVSQAALFAREHAKGAARKMLDALDEIAKNSVRITKIALGVSMPHQIAFLLGLILPYLHVTTPVGNYALLLQELTHILGMLLLVGGVPIAADLLIVNCIRIAGEPAASDRSKKVAMYIMVLPVSASVAVNVMAPAPHWILRVLAGFIVGVIPAAQILKVLVEPNFAKIEEMELKAEANLARGFDAVVTTEVATSEPTVDQRQLNKQRMVAAQKARELAVQAPDISLVQLMRATGCGRGAAKKAIELARQADTELETVAV
jgi:hypothetical protein